MPPTAPEAVAEATPRPNHEAGPQLAVEPRDHRCLTANTLFIPLGKNALGVGSLVVGFYVVATPTVAVVALTDLVTTDVTTKMVMCVSATAIAQVRAGPFSAL